MKTFKKFSNVDPKSKNYIIKGHIFKDDDTYFYIFKINDTEEYIEIDEDILNSPEELFYLVNFTGNTMAQLIGRNPSFAKLWKSRFFNDIHITQIVMPDNSELEIHTTADEFIDRAIKFFV